MEEVEPEDRKKWGLLLFKFSEIWIFQTWVFHEYVEKKILSKRIWLPYMITAGKDVWMLIISGEVSPRSWLYTVICYMKSSMWGPLGCIPTYLCWPHIDFESSILSVILTVLLTLTRCGVHINFHWLWSPKWPSWI